MKKDFGKLFLISEDGNKILQRYGDTVKEAKQDLQDAIEELEFKPGINNRYVLWGDLSEEEKRKINLLSRKVKSEVMGEWGTMEEHFTRWQRIMYASIQEIYPHKLTKADYDRA